MAPEYKRHPEILRVLAVEFEAFNYDGKIGQANNIELDLHFKPNARVASSPDIKYD